MRSLSAGMASGGLFAPVRLPRQLFPCRHRQLIRSVIPLVLRVSANPVPLNLVNLPERDQPSPEVLVRDSLPVRVFPSVQLPLRKPALGKRISDVLRIGEDVDGAGLLERFQTLDCGGELHPVVGRRQLCTRYLLARLVPLRNQNRAPSADPGIGRACAVAENGDVWLHSADSLYRAGGRLLVRRINSRRSCSSSSRWILHLEHRALDWELYCAPAEGLKPLWRQAVARLSAASGSVQDGSGVANHGPRVRVNEGDAEEPIGRAAGLESPSGATVGCT